VTALETAVERLADRLRAAPQSKLRRGAAAEGLALARELSARAQSIEFPDREPVPMPDAGVFVVADQLAVAGHDLAMALRGAEVARLSDAVVLVKAAAERCGL